METTIEKTGWSRLWAIIKWRLSRKKWTGKRIYIAGKMRPVTGETFDFVYIKGLKLAIRKNSRYLKHAK